MDEKSFERQQGATWLGMLIVGAMVVFVALINMKMVPAYTEFFSVKQVLRAIKQDTLGVILSKEISDSFDRRVSAAYVDVIKGSDLAIEKGTGDGAVVSVGYQVIKPMMGNVSVF
ncbi:MAG: DUF4845 domain-containing protein [Betaproteobacteria bacterium]|nr:DUF4845 domain-containing protein [Betaproteobacteria bacterium]